jgi:hypothetical protein
MYHISKNWKKCHDGCVHLFRTSFATILSRIHVVWRSPSGISSWFGARASYTQEKHLHIEENTEISELFLLLCAQTTNVVEQHHGLI